MRLQVVNKMYQRSRALFWMLLGALYLLGCSAALPDVVENPPTVVLTPTEVMSVPSDAPVADVVAVTVTGTANTYQFSVEVLSPDEGCDQYADWWEVLTEDGALIYRRILAHSHVNEQPFVRSGGPVKIEPDTVVLVRAHMHPGGYGGQALRGSAQDGFAAVSVGVDFAAEVEILEPQPTGCAF